MSNRKVMALITVAALMLFVANLSIWIWTTIIDSDGFTEVVYSATNEEEVRHAIATIIVNDIMEGMPIARAVIGDQITLALTDMLATEPFDLTFDRIASTVHRIVVSGSSEAVVIDASTISRIVYAIILPLWSNTVGVPPRQFPEEIVLVEGREFPGLKTLIDATPWAALVSVAGTLTIGGVAIFRAANRRLALIIAGFATIGVTALTLVLLLPLRTAVLNDVIIREQRTIVGSVYDTLLLSLRAQSLVLAGLGAILIIASIFAERSREPGIP